MALDSSGIEDRTILKQREAKSRGDQENGEEQELWRRFAEAGTPKAFCESWLALQCRMFRNTRCALLLLGTPDTGPFTPSAVYPSPLYAVTHLAAVAERALKERRGVLAPASSGQGGEGPPAYHIAYPIDVSGKIHGAVVLEVDGLALD